MNTSKIPPGGSSRLWTNTVSLCWSGQIPACVLLNVRVRAKVELTLRTQFLSKARPLPGAYFLVGQHKTVVWEKLNEQTTECTSLMNELRQKTHGWGHNN